MNHHANITRIKAVYNALGNLRDNVVFIGGAIISFYPDREVMEVRPTDDIDILIEILSYAERSILEEQLRSMGFTHDIASGIVCRFKIQGIIVDVLPTDDHSIGFSNIWYPEGFKTSVHYRLDEHHVIRILSAPYFLAIKLEAFKGRGGNDGRTSQDFEDIVFILENRGVIWTEIMATNRELKEYLKGEFIQLLAENGFYEWIDSHVERNTPRATDQIIAQIKKFVEDQI
ncbi:MAG: hypothetical protein WAT91_15695 [Saprospiraceae bacterium]